MISAEEAKKLTEQSIENIKNNQGEYIQSELKMIESMIKERCKNEESLFPINEIEYKFDERLEQKSKNKIIDSLKNNGFSIICDSTDIIGNNGVMATFYHENIITIKW